MKPPRDENGRLEELLLRWEDEDLIPEETEELTRILHTSRKARHALTTHYLLDVGIAQHLESEQAQKRLVPLERGNASMTRWLTLAAALILVLIGGWWFLRPPVARRLWVAKVTGEVVVTRGGKTTPARRGMTVQEGDRLMVKAGGNASVNYEGEETRIEMKGTTTASYRAENGAKRVRLESGMLTCTVAPQKLPLEIKTPHAVARVLGTIFTLESDTAATRIEVMTGRVRLTRSTNNVAVDVPAGHEAAVSNEADPRVEPTRPRGLLLDLNFEDRILPERTVGTVVACPPTANSRFCVAGLWNEGDRLFRVNIRNGDRTLITYREGAVLSFDYWAKEHTGAIDVYFWNKTRSVSCGFIIQAPVQGKWTHVEKRLSDCTDELGDGDLLWDFSIQTTPGGNELFVDNFRIEVDAKRMKDPHPKR